MTDCVSFKRYAKFGLHFLASSFLSIGCLESTAQTPTQIQVTNVVQQAQVTRPGINLSDHTYWDSGQMMKNLVFWNPGFEGMKYRSIMKCAAVTATTCRDDNEFSSQPTGFWTKGSYLILSGVSAGKSGTVVSSTAATNCASCGQVITFDKAIDAAVGDYFAVTNYFPGKGDQGWWDDVSGGGKVSTELTDLSPETPGKQALLLSASGSGQGATVTQYFDTVEGVSFLQLNGSYEVSFRAKGVGGNNQLNVEVARLQTGVAAYLDQTLTLTNAWKDYTLTFTAKETGTSVGDMLLAFTASGASVELDDVALEQTNSSAANTTAFRDEVVDALTELHPGTIRMMAAGAALGSDIPNQLNVPFARYREGYNTGGNEVDNVSYGIHEFLQLCDIVGADPWITIPTATTPAEMTEFVEYLTGTGADTFSASRIARGQTAPWTSVFKTIHIEFGNETWNGIFKGESMSYPAYPLLANQVFASARATKGFDPTKFDLVLSGWASVPGYNQGLLAYATEQDSIDIAPYLLYSVNNEAQATMFGALFAEAEVFDIPGGEVYENLFATQGANRVTNLNVYEVNLGGMLGSATQTQLTQLTPSAGAGVATENHILQMMRLGVKAQNAFSLPQYQVKRADGSLVDLWGMVVDMGNTNRRRPQFLTEALGNSVIGGSMLQTIQTGTNPRWNQPLSSDGVQVDGAHYLQSFAFSNGGETSLILFNLNLTTALPVAFTGANAPSGSVEESQLTAPKITDNNETSNTVATVSKTLSAFNAAAAFSLPPYSMTVLSWKSTTTQVPTFSVSPGEYSAAQTVAITDGSLKSTIYYTIDGSTPTTASTVYTGPIKVGANEVIRAMATSTTLLPSGVASASYVFGQHAAAAPYFTIPGGSYTSDFVVAIGDSTPAATIYYTTDGSIPTVNSMLYSTPIVVNTSVTVNAIAIANGYSPSGVGAARYNIAPIANPAAAPLFSVASGTYVTPFTLTITDKTPGASIFYEINGANPTLYAGPLTVSVSEAVEAVAQAPNYGASPVAAAQYMIEPYAASPAFSVKGGTYATTQTVVMTDATAGAVIYYTTNGATPTAASTKYTAAIAVSATETIKAIAVATGYVESAVATATYTIDLPANAIN